MIADQVAKLVHAAEALKGELFWAVSIGLTEFYRRWWLLFYNFSAFDMEILIHQRKSSKLREIAMVKCVFADHFPLPGSARPKWSPILPFCLGKTQLPECYIACISEHNWQEKKTTWIFRCDIGFYANLIQIRWNLASYRGVQNPSNSVLVSVEGNCAPNKREVKTFTNHSTSLASPQCWRYQVFEM